MATERPVYFLCCEECGHHVNTRKLPVTDIDEVYENLGRYKCSECGYKRVTVREKPKTVRVIEYVATEMTMDRVFHKSSCGHMRNVSAQNEIRFKDRDSAVRQGFDPCTSCRP